MSAPELLLLPPLAAVRGKNGRFQITKKYLEGVEMYRKLWPGPVSTLTRFRDQASTEMDLQDIEDEHRIAPRPSGRALEERLRGVGLALGFLAPDDAELVDAAERAGTPLVSVTEYSLETELQIIRAEPISTLRKLRRVAWTLQAEATRRRMVPRLSGLQCSGTPAFRAHAHSAPNPLLYFDSRVKVDEVMSAERARQRMMERDPSSPLRLVFGGRLIAMKGAGDLPRLAELLRHRGVNFHLSIVGSGPLESEIRGQIADRRLGELVELRGPMDFRSGWLPLLRTEVDLFVCCHPQGDPSSTYPEVMSCGVPIVGYGNGAFRGIQEHSGAGWVVPIGDLEAMANTLERLASDRSPIAHHAARATEFAQAHAFERTFERRVAHLLQCAGLGATRRESAVAPPS